jgi:hypothetical protein
MNTRYLVQKIRGWSIHYYFRRRYKETKKPICQHGIITFAATKQCFDALTKLFLLSPLPLLRSPQNEHLEGALLTLRKK